MSLFFLLAAGSLPTLISGAPLPSTLFARANDFITHLTEKRSAGFGDVYIQYTGSGEQGWPSMNDWVDFDTLFSTNVPIIEQSCTQFGTANPSDDEINDIKNAIQTVAGESGVDERFIFAIMMQESNGCVRAPTTNYGVRNPGLMQDHNGAATCNEGTVSNPCPASTITQMIRDGTEGTSSGDGLKQCIAESDASGAASYYRAARIYNSGSISDDNLSAGVATHCYSSDIANRLTGWVHAQHDCNLDGASVPVNTVMPTGDSGSAATTSSSPATSAAPTTTSTPSAPTTTATPTTTSTPQETTPATTTSSAPAYSFESAPSALPTISIPRGHGVPHKGQVSAASSTATTTIDFTTTTIDFTTTTATSTPTAAATSVQAAAASPAATMAPGVTSDCAQYYTVQSGDNCWLLGQEFGFTLAEFQGWNTQIDDACSNLWLGYSYCVKG